jgi:hypothetical protein
MQSNLLPIQPSGKSTTFSGMKASFRLGLIFLAILLVAKVSFGQVQVLPNGIETFGVVGGTTTLVNYPATNQLINRPTISLTQGGGITPADVRVSGGSASSGYSTTLPSTVAASGGSGVFFTAIGTITAALEGINAAGAVNLRLQFGYRKELATALPVLAIAYWNGSAYVNVPFTFNEAATAPVAWYLSPVISLPSAAAIAGLRIQFQKSGANSTRIDDVTLVKDGAALPGISISANIRKFIMGTANVPSNVWRFNVSGNALTGNITVGPQAGYEFSTSGGGPYSATINLIPSSGSVASTDLYIRKTAAGTSPIAQTIGSFNISSPGITTVSVADTFEVFNSSFNTFSPNNLIISTLGDGRYTPRADFAPLFLSEITKTGTLVQRVLLAPDSTATNKRVSMSGSSTTSAQLNLSTDGKFLTFAGSTAPYNTAIGAANNVLAYPKVIGRLDFQGNLNSTTLITDAYNGDNIRSAVTTDGNAYWTTGQNPTNINGLGGVRYVTLGSAGSSVSLHPSWNNNRFAYIQNSQLYVGSASGAFTGINVTGNGLPTTTDAAAGAATTRIINTPNVYQFVLLDRDPVIPGADAIYIADFTNGIAKYSFDGTTWTARGNLTTITSTGIFAEKEGNNVRLYITNNPNTAAGTPPQLYTFVDQAAYNATMTSSGTALTTSGTLLLTGPANTVFRGIVTTPIAQLPSDVVITPSNVVTNPTQGQIRQQLYTFRIDVSSAPATLSRIVVPVTGTYQGTDIDNFRLYSSTDAVLDATDLAIGSSVASTSSGAGETLTLNLFQSLPVGTNYILLGTDVSGCATPGGTLTTGAVVLDSIKFNGIVNKAGTTLAGTTKTIQAGTPSDVTGLSVNPGTSAFVNWNDVTCITDYLVVAHTASITGTPVGNSYVADANFTGAGSAFPGGGKVVFKGTASDFVLTGLTVGQSYAVKVFTRNGSIYSTPGIQITFTATNTTFFSRGSGVHTGAIWALTPTGTPATITSLGGFSATTNITVQAGDSVAFTASSLNMRDFTVNGKATATGTDSADVKYMNVYGNVVVNGAIVGNGNPRFFLLSFNVEGATVNVTGNGSINIGRVRKTFAAPATTNLIFDAPNTNIWFPGTGIYNNTASRLNVTINNGRNVNLRSSTGSVAIDGVDGTGSGERSGILTVNGYLGMRGTLFIQNNNAIAANTTPVNIGSAGRILADSVSLSATAVVGLAAAAPITIANGGRLDISRSLNIISGDIAGTNVVRFMSSATRTARLRPMGGSSTITASVLFERFVPTLGWHFMNAPVRSAGFSNISGLATRIFPAVSPNTFIYTETDTTTTVINGNRIGIAGWRYGVAGSILSTATQSVGFRYYARANERMTVTGVPFVGNVAHTVTRSINGYDGGGWNLVGNPYISEIDWTAVKSDLSNATGLDATYYVWNNALQQYGTFISGAPSGLLGASRYIAAGQSFFVKGNQTPGTNTILTFKEIHKASGNFNTFLRTANFDNFLTMRLQGNTAFYDESVIRFINGATVGFDSQLDSYKLPGTYLNVSSLPEANLNLAFNSMPELTDRTVLPLKVWTAAIGTYTITFTGMDSFDANNVLYLKDNFLNTLTDIRSSAAYTFSITSNAASTGSTRFELVTGPASVTSLNGTAKSAFILSPNPAQGSVKVSAAGLMGTQATISLLNAAGQATYSVVVPIQAGALVTELPLATPAGIYIVRMQDAIGVRTQKLVVR